MVNDNFALLGQSLDDATSYPENKLGVETHVFTTTSLRSQLDARAPDLFTSASNAKLDILEIRNSGNGP
jgi:hypothetical protein